MEFIVSVETRLAGKTLAVQEVAKFNRCASGIAPEEIGLTLHEGKEALKQVQRNIVQTQISLQGTASSLCMHCSGRQIVKDIRTRQIQTVFGKITVACRRYIRCIGYRAASGGFLRATGSKPVLPADQTIDDSAD